MTIKIEKKLRDFEFWSGAKTNAEKLTAEELDYLEEQMDEICQIDGGTIMTETQVNDFMWFDFETICEWLDLDYEEVMARE